MIPPQNSFCLMWVAPRGPEGARLNLTVVALLNKKKTQNDIKYVDPCLVIYHLLLNFARPLNKANGFLAEALKIPNYKML